MSEENMMPTASVEPKEPSMTASMAEQMEQAQALAGGAAQPLSPEELARQRSERDAARAEVRERMERGNASMDRATESVVAAGRVPVEQRTSGFAAGCLRVRDEGFRWACRRLLPVAIVVGAVIGADQLFKSAARGDFRNSPAAELIKKQLGSDGEALISNVEEVGEKWVALETATTEVVGEAFDESQIGKKYHQLMGDSTGVEVQPGDVVVSPTEIGHASVVKEAPAQKPLAVVDEEPQSSAHVDEQVQRASGAGQQ